MVTETVNIRFRSTGTRVIKRRVDDIGFAADRATKGLFLMQRALFALGAIAGLRALVSQLDLLTDYENRLRLTATSAENLETVQRRLFDVAVRSRTSFQAVAEVYTRTALSVRELGISQAETIAFTERLSKATIISGASAREANAALVQLGQGMASNTLRGDELRSVLEQLPFVADVISKSLGISRGELRIWGAEGRISAEVILKAFREAGSEIDALFANTIPTIGQALTVFGTNIQSALDKFDDATGFSPSVAKSIIAVGNSIDKIVVAATLATAVFAGLFADKFNTRIVKAIKKELEFSKAVRLGNIVLLNSVTAETARSAAIANSATVSAKAAIDRQAELVQISARIALKKADAAQTVLDTQFIVANGAARNLATGQYVSLNAAKNALSVATQRLSILEAAEATISTKLAVAKTRVAATSVALTAAKARLALATTAASTAVARFAATFPLLTRGILAATGAVRAFFGLLIANPITVLLIAVTAAAFALRKLGDASQKVNKIVDQTDSLMRKVAEAMALAKKNGEELVDTFNDVTAAQLQLQRTEAIDAQREAIRALADQLVGFNAQWTDLKTLLTLDFTFSAATDQVSILAEELRTGTISLTDFKDKLATLASEVNDAKFTEFTRGLIDSIVQVENAGEQIEILDALIAVLSGTASASQEALLRMAAGLDAVGGSANAASGAIEFFISKIPALAGAQKVATGLAEASTQLSNGIAALNVQQRAGEISALELIAAQSNLNNLYNQAVSEIDGTAKATRSANAELERYNNQADLASRTGLDRTIARATQEYDALRTSLIEAGAGTEKLAAAEQNYQTILAAARRDQSKKGGGGASAAAKKDLAEILAGKTREIELLRLSNDERRVQEGILKIENDLKRNLSQTEQELAKATLQSLEAAKTQAEVLDSIIGPREKIAEQQKALNELFAQGRIGLEDYTNALRNMQVAADAAAGTMAGGFKSAINGAILSVSELGSALGDILVGAADSAANAIVEFAKTGKFNLKSFFADIFAQITKLIAKQLILKALGFVFGGFSAGGSIGPQGGVPGLANGGSFKPSGPGSTDSQLVSFAKRPDERVDILTPGQQAAQRNNMNGSGGGNTVVQSPPVNVAAVFSEADIVGAFDGDEGETVIINMLQRNASTVRSIVNG